MADYDIVIIGGSPAGRYAAAIAAQMKATVALVEWQQLPIADSRLPTTDSLSYVGQLTQQCDKLGIFGLNLRCGDASQDGQTSVEWKQIMQWVQGVRANLEEENSPVVLAALGVDFIQGQAKFVAQPQLGLVVNDRSLVARNYLIATNPRPLIPDIEGLEATKFLTASEVLPSLTAANLSLIHI